MTFRVTYHRNNTFTNTTTGGFVRSQTATGSGIVLRTNINGFNAVPGYVFKEWNTNPDGTGTSFMPGANTGTLTDHLHLFAIWEAIPYQVTINGGGPNTTGSGTFTVGQNVTLSAGTREGYTFNRWNVTSGGAALNVNATNPENSFTMPPHDVIIEAVWTATPFQVTVNGSYGATPNSGAGPYTVGTTVTIRAGTRAGWDFTGWTVNSGGVALADPSSATTTFSMPANAVTVTANWTPVQAPTFAVTVNGSQVSNSGTGTYTAGTLVTIRAGTNNGSTFTRWNTTSNGVSLASATNATTTFVMPANNVIINAIWTEVQAPTFQVTVNGSFASNTGAGSYAAGQQVTVNAGTRTGFNFSGWTVNSSGAIPGGFPGGAPSSATFTMPANNVTVTANWTAIPSPPPPPTYQVTVNGSHATNTGAGPYTAGQTVTINAGTRSGFTFGGWTVTSGGVTLVSSSSATTTFTMPGNHVTVAAAWTQVTTTPTFRVTVNGSQVSNNGSGTYTAGQTVTIRAGSLSGNDFSRWNTSSSGVSLGSPGNATTSFTMPANNVTVTATWTPVTGGDDGGGNGGGGDGDTGGGTGGGGGGTTPPEPFQPGNEPPINPPLIIEPPEQPAPPPIIETPESEPAPIGVGNNSSNSRHVVRQLFGDNHPVMTIGDTLVPLVGPRHIATWALFNLLLMICGIILAAYATTKTVMQRSRRKRDREEEIMLYMREGRSFNGDESPSETRVSKRKTLYIILTCVLAVIGLILFIVTQDMTATMVFVDFWTIFHVLFVGLHIVALILLARKLKAVVSYKGNPGRGTVTEKVLVGETLNEPNIPTRKGYIFDGWYADYEYTEKWESYRPVDRDTTLYAKWKPEPTQVLQQTDTQVATA